MTIADISIAHPDLILSPTINSISEIQLDREFQPVLISDEDVYVVFFTVTGAFIEFEKAVEEDHTVADLRVVGEYGDRRVYRVYITDRAKVVTPILAQLGIQLLNVSSSSDGWMLRILVPKRSLLSTFKTHCDAEKISFRVNQMYREEKAETSGIGLTSKQRDALVIARKQGYFDDPREISLQELSAMMEVSPSALGRRIRRATRTLIDSVLGSNK
ncbi:helix-turn-helix domain-containing protein [Haladaptatus caseinilyticus]|uniref:helix-turn-helix domain-containing protein n=1 Tax=Haladaptatus caseinilyticus TaxID=2993314 RepID=UPI00224ABC6B|nr:helix-turn-helix domain-containing protein [Haladaptatus caseinilyticus]